MSTVNHRAYGCALIKAVNSNYNADFSHRPRTLPNGTAYATDKALKYMIRNYWVQHLNGNRDYVLYWKRLNEDMNPLDLDSSYAERFGELKKKGKGKNDKSEVLTNLLKCLDVRTFGATFANKQAGISLSIHGPLQITHGLNRYPNSSIYAEQISSPFADQKEGKDAAEQTTLGTQYKIDRAYYAHGISLNPGNLTAHYALEDVDAAISAEDVEKIKTAIRLGPTYYDSSAKAGTETALLLWVNLRDGSQLVLPSLVELIEVSEDETVDLARVTELLERESIAGRVASVELYHEPGLKVINAPAGTTRNNLF